MAISPEVEAQILRYYHAEKWTVGTIATQLKVHHGTVARVLAQAGLPRIGRDYIRHRRIRADVCPLGRGPQVPNSQHGARGPRPSGPNAGRRPGVTRKSA